MTKERGGGGGGERERERERERDGVGQASHGASQYGTVSRGLKTSAEKQPRLTKGGEREAGAEWGRGGGGE